MTSLLVRPVQHADVATCTALRTVTLGSLVIGRPPPFPDYKEDQMVSIKNDLDNKPHVHHLKVVDTESDDEIIAYAKWEIYPQGRPDLEGLKQPMDDESKKVDQYGRLREAAHEYFCTRNGEMGKHPHVLLALLVTAPQHRRRGAGSLLVQWGIAKSEELGLPAYLQASAQGQRLYQSHGFKDIDTVEFNLTDFGLEGMEKMTEMIRHPVTFEKTEVGISAQTHAGADMASGEAAKE
ncbi:Acetyltransferase domain containing protein [Pyrenophora tritici-repentis]|uniref:Acetyltransferase domain containing protein n=1 Tax=Pyrenophora tritici-repentis TaxID=45151 RepID=A0A922T1A5_9PLEO|nr:Acetyltransferase domain containing protein [Pyrenophora tritici-repentis]KAI1664487.1 Acetyltransferase domain containing protein [Pyrenophora tritici-repentis]KAI1678596.1 Acetyltransferase domain containing protein [Pyrenophora tritici-repentis]